MACIFCGSAGPMTIEHVAARWARDAIAEITAGEPVRQVFTQAPEKTLRTDTGLSIRLPGAICETCNTGWLSRWETTVGRWLASAVRGDIMVIAEGDMQKRVAAWAVKTALLFAMSTVPWGVDAYIPESNLHWLYEHRDTPEPPPGSYVWLGRADITATVAHITGGWLGDEPEQRDAFVAVFTIGRLVVLVFGQEFLTRSPKPARLPRQFGPLLLEIWPNGNPLMVWPPGDRFTEDEFRRLGWTFAEAQTKP